jgi:glycosyltransferase involved in cell wall biosynthesis
MRSTVTEKGPDVDAVGMLQPAPVAAKPITGRGASGRTHEPSRRLSILSVGTTDIGGGAEKVGSNLFEGYASRGHRSTLAVGHRKSDHPDVVTIPNGEHRGAWPEFWWRLHDRIDAHRRFLPGAGRIRRVIRPIAELSLKVPATLGIEDLNYPGTRSLLEIVRNTPDLLHLHNLHGGYFDLRELSTLSKRLPVVLTMHDAWMLGGHCAHSFNCERWKTGCGSCPDLGIYPAIERDATSFNWRRKHGIYSRSRIYVSTPSRWLMDKVEQSMLNQAVIDARVIPNGVDRSVFHPGDMAISRARLGIPADARVLLFTANGVRHNVFKDYETLKGAIAHVAEQMKGEKVIFVALGEGEEVATEQVGNAEIRYITYQPNVETVARYYQSANLYLHASRADTFPNSVIEALACGTPVIGTAVGGIPEQVRGLKGAIEYCQDRNTFGPDRATGLLVPAGESDAMATAIVTLLRDDDLLRRLAHNADADATARFDVQRQIDAYLEWFEEIMESTGEAR